MVKKKDKNASKSIRAWSTIGLKGLIPENIQWSCKQVSTNKKHMLSHKVFIKEWLLFLPYLQKKNTKQTQGSTGRWIFGCYQQTLKSFSLSLFFFFITMVVQWLHTDKSPSCFSCQILNMKIQDSPREKSYAHVLFDSEWSTLHINQLF